MAKINEAKQFIKDNLWFPVTVSVTPGVSQRGSRESSENGAPLTPTALSTQSTVDFPSLKEIAKAAKPVPRYTTPILLSERDNVMDDGYIPVQSKKRGIRVNLYNTENPIVFSSGEGQLVTTKSAQNSRKFFSLYKQRRMEKLSIDFNIPDAEFAPHKVQETPVVEEVIDIN